MNALHGTVVAFDASVGLGEVKADDGRVIPFHCIEILDGTRTIEVGAGVSFELIAKLGTYEAARLQAG